ncbi:nucleoside diphosphate kinase regulator [Mesorhizobium microcysteis]|uniref:Nucleoside diphosphate kinase regulator n=1 Tax=Neoaquamicrobium microcysteis TaxID=2682781 RepID=A0A5D4H0E0_9HYPH|nr:nucleoside diphosphate kinase regulator [Mesorhizobium microcysteis]TYR34336.1 nucleoside diphosphate kinase regulator [Mesorhizobium microcysteis]
MTMNKPEIVISKVDHGRLTQLANGLLDSKPDMADGLLSELERASVVADDAVPADTVQMGTTLEYTSNDGNGRRVTLVYPGEADIAEGKISILTPIGTALLGLGVGQSIEWVANDGKAHVLTVNKVERAPST